MENKVNNLNGTDWLKNAVNFWFFDSFDINTIHKRFKQFCYKNRTDHEPIFNNENYLTNENDFSFSIVKTIENANASLRTAIYGTYNSYHVFLILNEFENNIPIATYLYNNAIKNYLEYRGKIVLYFKDTKTILISQLFLNRLNEESKANINEFKLPNPIKHVEKKPFVIESKSKIDKIGLKHPAPYSYIDIEELTKIESINNKIILDPFLGVGSTIIGTYKNNKNIGIELNPKYIDLIKERFNFLNINEAFQDSQIICGDSLMEVDKIKTKFDDVITSPPYFNILKNNTSGVRTDNSQSRQGIEYYSDLSNDIGNLETLNEYSNIMQNLFAKIYNKISENGKIYLVVSDFTVDKKEQDIHSMFLKVMNEAGFTYRTTSYILQNQKVIYPFGYPYKIVINHIFQYIMIFEKNEQE